MTYKKSAKNSNFFGCEFCDYNTCKKGDYDRHLQTQKHKNNEILINGAHATNKLFICECGKKYKHNQSLYNHKKKCDFKVITNKKEETNCQVILQNNIDQNMIMKLISENNDIKNLLLIQQQQLLEQQKQLGEQHRQLVEIVPKIGNITNNTASRYLLKTQH